VVKALVLVVELQVVDVVESALDYYRPRISCLSWRVASVLFSTDQLQQRVPRRFHCLTVAIWTSGAEGEASPDLFFQTLRSNIRQECEIPVNLEDGLQRFAKLMLRHSSQTPHQILLMKFDRVVQ
jgi:hypothetical protein